MKKRILAITLVMMMVVCALPSIASAKPQSDAIKINGQVAGTSKAYTSTDFNEITEGSVVVQFYNASGEKISSAQNATKAVITLNNTTISSTEDYITLIVCNIDTKFVLKGTNYIKDTAEGAYGIASGACALSFAGDGELFIETDQQGIYGGITGGDAKVYFNDTVKVNVKAKGYAITSSKEVIFNLAYGGIVEATTDFPGAPAISVYSDETIILGKNNEIVTPTNGTIVTVSQDYQYIGVQGTNAEASHVVVANNTPDTDSSAETGDNTMIGLYMGLGILALAGASIALIRRRTN